MIVASSAVFLVSLPAERVCVVSLFGVHPLTRMGTEDSDAGTWPEYVTTALAVAT